MRTLVVFALAVAAVAAYPENIQRIVGGSVTSIEVYPSMAALLFSWGTTGHFQACGGSVLNSRSILTAAHCTEGDAAVNWQTRLGSTRANSGGSVFGTSLIITHPNYDFPARFDNDIAILRLASNIYFSNVIQPASIAGSSYNLADNEAVWATGWGATESAIESEELRHVQVWTVNQQTCRNNYGAQGWTVSDNMLCSGWLGVGGRDQCQGDSGGPLYHNGVVVGVCSWGIGCAHPNFPGVNARVSRFTAWIQANA